MTDDDRRLIDILTRTRVIACVIASPNPGRPSHYVSVFLRAQGYRVIGVNPGHAGRMMFGEPVVARISDLPPEVDFVDVFRRPSEVLPLVETALEALPNLRTIWMQLGVQNSEAAALADSRGIDVVQNRCPKIEVPRLLGKAN